MAILKSLADIGMTNISLHTRLDLSRVVAGKEHDGSYTYPGIPAGSANTVTFRLLLGLFSQSKDIQPMWGGLTFEMEIVRCADDVNINQTITGGHSLTTDASSQWQIEDVRLAGDVCTLDNALQTYMPNMF